jgi:hypothetical protein
MKSELYICNRAKPACKECYHARPHAEVPACKEQKKCYGSPDGGKMVECVKTAD